MVYAVASSSSCGQITVKFTVLCREAVVPGLLFKSGEMSNPAVKYVLTEMRTKIKTTCHC